MHRYPNKRPTYGRYQPKTPRNRSRQKPESTTPSPLQLIPAPSPNDIVGVWEVGGRSRWSFKKIAAIAVPLVVIVAGAIFVVPSLLAAHQAYNKIFVPRVPQYRVVLNANGTPVIAQSTQAPPPTPAPTAQIAASGTIATPAASPTQSTESTPTPVVNLPTWDGTSRINILLLGSDTRGAGQIGRSDTMILVTINPVTKQVGMLSIPRDLLVSIPNYGQAKINAAYAYGSVTKLTGPGLAVATVEYNFGVRIDYFAEVNTMGLASIINTLGGVTLDVPAPIKDNQFPGSGSNYLRVIFHTGLQHMNGTQAVEYARTRHDDSDFARSVRQQQLLRALRAQAVGLNLLSKAPTLLNQLANTFRTDLSPTQLLELAKLGSTMNSSDIHSYSMLDAISVSYSPGQPYYLIPNWPAIHKVLNQMMSH